MLGLVFLPSTAFAQATPDASEERDMEANLRLRRLSVPGSIMDSWFYDEDDGSPYERPKIRGTVFGAELVLRRRPNNWTFYVEYLGNTTDEGYWDDVEHDEPVDHNDGDWVRPDSMGAVVVGANLDYELRLTRPGADIGGAFLFGGGLGAAFVTGNLLTWHDGTVVESSDPCLPKSDSWDRYETCPDDGNKSVPRVLPMVDVTVSAKVDYQEHYHLRLDLGIHDLFYVGLAGGVAF